MSAKRSGWIAGVVVLQLLYTLMLLALPVYLLAVTRSSGIRNSPDAAEEISGLRVAAAVVGAPVLLALIAWVGLWKEKLWGWWLTVLTDLGLLGIFGYSLIDDGWNNLDWDVVALTAIAVVPLVYLFLRRVRQFYWGSGTKLPPVAMSAPPA